MLILHYLHKTDQNRSLLLISAISPFYFKFILLVFNLLLTCYPFFPQDKEGFAEAKQERTPRPPINYISENHRTTSTT